MVLPDDIALALSEGDLDTVEAYFEDDSDGARDVDICAEGHPFTPLMQCARGNDDELTLGNVEVARYLLSRGASVDKRTLTGQTALLIACYTSHGTVTEMVSLLLSAGADPNARNNFGRTPLNAHVEFCQTPSVECVTALLRGGASLDRVRVRSWDGHEFAFEETRSPDSDEEPETRDIFWPAVRALAAGVRRNGSFKRYLREPHREVLLLRGLAMRGHFVPRRRTRGTAEWTAATAFLARLGDNGVVWNVLSFWRAAK